MNGSGKRSMEETLAALRRMALEEAELERVEAMSGDELDRYLVAKGINLSSLENRAAGLLAKAHAYGAEVPSAPAEVTAHTNGNGAKPAAIPLDAFRPREVRPPNRRSVRSTLQIAVAVVFAGGALAALAVTVYQEYRHPGLTNDQYHAQELRRQATEECTAAHWGDCLHDLDTAKTFDPPGDEAPEVKATRAKAKSALGLPP